MANESTGVSRMHTRRVDSNGSVATIPTLFAYKVMRNSLAEISREPDNKIAVSIPTPGLDPREHTCEFVQ